MCERSVYHRDVSIGNILINSYPTPQNVGVLIDLDHASKSPRSGPHDPQTVRISKSLMALN